MHLSTSAASRLIAMLESEIKLRLFNRTRRSLTLTPQGEAFCREAEHILAGFDEIPRIASDMRSRPQGQSRLVTGPRLAAQRSVSAHDLREEPLLGLWPGQRWRQQVDDFFEAGGVRPRYAVETRSPLMSCQLAQLGAGVGQYSTACARRRWVCAAP
jgi:DNA-binding transcriptional LysR family regulator